MDFFRKQIAKAEETIRARGLLDTRVLALFGVGVIAISIFWNGAGIIQQNYDLAQKTAAIEQENEILELENRKNCKTNTWPLTNLQKLLIGAYSGVRHLVSVCIFCLKKLL